jgi:hypothetical protein
MTDCPFLLGHPVYTWFWWGDLRERDHLEALDADERIILKWV